MSAIDEIRPGRCPLGLRAPAGFPGVLPAECGRLEAGAPLSFTGHAVLLLHLCGGAQPEGTASRPDLIDRRHQ